jgi:hypothetical protein
MSRALDLAAIRDPLAWRPKSQVPTRHRGWTARHIAPNAGLLDPTEGSLRGKRKRASWEENHRGTRLAPL